MRVESGIRVAVACAVVCVMLGAVASAAPGATLPAQFDDQPVTSADAPTAFAFTPDGRMLITTKTGPLRVYQGGSLLATPAIDLSSVTCANSERGLLGVAVDPQFASNRFVYLYYTFKKFGVCDTRAYSFREARSVSLRATTLPRPAFGPLCGPNVDRGRRGRSLGQR